MGFEYDNINEVGNKHDIGLQESDIIVDNNIDNESIDNREVKYYSENEFNELYSLPEYLKGEKLDIELYNIAKDLLCGLDEELNKDEFLFVEDFLKILLKEDEHDLAMSKKEKYSLFEDNEKTNEIKDFLMNHNDSPISKQREILQISSSEEEKKFDIRVLKPDGWDEVNFMKKDDLWLELTGAPDAFVNFTKKEDEPIIYIRPDYNKDDVFKNEIIEHEYRHTQRSFRNNNGNLMRVWDEACNGIAGYQDITALLNLIYSTSEKIKKNEDVRAFESNDDNDKVEFIKKVKNGIGAKAFLLLASMDSSKYIKSEVTSLPLIEYKGDKDNAQAQFFETILVNIKKHNPLYFENIKKNIKELKLPKGQTIRGYLEVLNYYLKDYFRDIEETDASLLKEIKTFFDEEILKREKVGEKGL